MTPRAALFVIAASVPLVVSSCDEGDVAPRIDATETAIADFTDPDGDPDAILIGFDQLWVHHVEHGWIGFTTFNGFMNLGEPQSLIGTMDLFELPDGGFDRIILHVTNAGVVVHGDIWMPLAVEYVDRMGLLFHVRFCVQNGEVQGLPSDWNAEERVHYAEVGYWLEGEIEVASAPVCAGDLRVTPRVEPPPEPTAM
jgi:hypothetical protein